jgi:type I restriction enzyme S subunit
MGKWDGKTEEAVSPAAIGNGTRLAPGGAIFIAVRGMSLHNEIRIIRSIKPLTFNQDVKAIVPYGGVDGGFLYYALLAKKRELLGSVEAAGHGTGRLPTDKLQALRIPYVPLPTQCAIASVLSALDEKIELNRRMNETLEAIAQALFKSWFVDFDPVRVLSGQMSEKAPFLTAEACRKAGFPDRFQDSELGEIPEGWRVGSIYEIADVIYGAPFASKLFNANGNGKPLVRIRDLADERPAVWTTEVLPKGYTVGPGEIVVGMDGEFRAYLWGGVDAWLNQRVCVFVPKPGFSAAFVRNSITGPLAQIEATETATTVIHLGKNDIDRFQVVIPEKGVSEAFFRVCQPCYYQIVVNKQQSRTLATLRDVLLPKLLSGELRVQEAESITTKL